MMDRRRFLLASLAGALAAPLAAETFSGSCQAICSLTLPQVLARHRRQVVLLVVRDLALPHDEDDLQPFRPQRPERLAMRVAPRALLVVVRPRPRTRQQREVRHLIDHVPQRLVAGETELDDSAACRSASSRARCRRAPAGAETTPIARGRPPGGPRASAR